MRKRTFAIAAAALGAALVGATALSAPWVANRMAEGEVDHTLAVVRKRGTAVASRGEVTTDIWTRTVVVRDVAVDTPGQNGAKVRVGRLTVERPGKDDGRITAARVRFDDIVVTVASETMTVPSVEVIGYDGPAEGLVGTAGAGSAVRTQADVLAEVSIESAVIPLIKVDNAKLDATRAATNIRFGRMTKGVVSRAAIDGVSLAVATQTAEDGSTKGGFSLLTGAIVAESLSVPAVLRFQAGDGAGQRERAFARASLSDLKVDTPTDRLGQVRLSAASVEAADIDIRALALSTAAIEDLETRRRQGEAPTPAELRRRILLLTDLVRAFAIGRITATTVAWDAAPPAGRARTGAAAKLELQGYADGRVARIGAIGATMASDAGKASTTEAEILKIDASGLLAYAERVGRDQALLTAAPPPDEILKLFPRAGFARVSGFSAEGRAGSLTVGEVRSGQRGDVQAVPNRVGIAVENFSAPIPRDRWFTQYLEDAGLQRLNLSFRLRMSLDPTTKLLTLDGLDYTSPDVADVKLTGALSGVDPALAIASGGDLIGKLSDVTLQPFTLRIDDHGGVAAALRSAARAEQEAPEALAERVASEAETRMTAVLGPSAQSSATALGLFLRKGGTLEATFAPRSTDTKLLDLLGLLKLGPTGIAQALDLTIVNRVQ